jgi:hypothetical protein
VTAVVAGLLALLARVASGPSVHTVEDQVCRRQCIFFGKQAALLFRGTRFSGGPG